MHFKKLERVLYALLECLPKSILLKELEDCVFTKELIIDEMSSLPCPIEFFLCDLKINYLGDKIYIDKDKWF